MSTDALRSNPADEMTSLGSGFAIGDADSHVFNCPACARPLSDGTSRCPGCGTRLVLGVTVKRAGAILGLGFVFGVLIGGFVTAAVITLTLKQPAVATGPDVVPTRPGNTSTGPDTRVATVPAGAVTALRGAAIVNSRITVDAAVLATALKTKGTSTVEVARALRALAADAALGNDLVAQIGRWPEAGPVMTQLDTFYGAMAATARDGLRASLTDNKAYRAAGTRMMKVLASLPGVDAATRVLAAGIGQELPPLVAPGASKAP